MVSEATSNFSIKNAKAVLILVLVEDGLGASLSMQESGMQLCLNPCFSGGWSRSFMLHAQNRSNVVSLNPCFSGGWSRSRPLCLQKRLLGNVLILVLVEDGLGVET